MNGIIFIAPQAAGKGTQAKLIEQKYQIPHISTGEILRFASLEQSERGRFLKEELKCGNLISDQVVLDLIKERLQNTDCAGGFILDGMPRNLAQAKSLDEILDGLSKRIGTVIVLDLDDEAAIKRILGRTNCPSCGSVYNETGIHPLKAGICDQCQTILIKREDDQEEFARHRLAIYHERTEPIIDYYGQRNLVHHIDSNQAPNLVFKDIVSILEVKHD